MTHSFDVARIARIVTSLIVAGTACALTLGGAVVAVVS